MTCLCGCGLPPRKNGKYHNWSHMVAHRRALAAEAAQKVADQAEARQKREEALRVKRAQERKGRLLEAIGGYQDGY